MPNPQFDPAPVVWWKPLLAATTILLLAGCASYQPQPLPESDDLADQVPGSINHQQLTLPPLGAYKLNPTDGLDSTSIAMLAVVHNPDIKAQRKQRGISGAQLFSAHLLPDPQFSFSFDHPTSNGPGLSNAHSLGLSYDLMSLISRSATLNVADYKLQQTSLDIVWKEWQLAQTARQTYFRLLADRQKVALYRKSAETQQQRYQAAQHELTLGNITLETLSSDLTGYADIQTLLYQARLAESKTRHRLNALLGLRPDVELNLKPAPEAVPELPMGTDINQARLLRQRPDLRALQAGYQSQEATVRRAVLRQFPSINLGFNKASDTSNVHTIGLGLQLNLPLWNANRGAIAVQRATRDALRQTYQARIDQTVSDVDRLRNRFQLLQSQYRQLKASLPTLQHVYQQALKAYQQGNFNSLSYLNIQDTLIKKQAEAIDLRLALWEARSSVETLLGFPINDAELTQTTSSAREKREP